MRLIIENISLLTKLVGAHLPVSTLMSHIQRDNQSRVNFGSISEYLKSEGFENTISERALEDIPKLSLPVVVVLRDGEAAVITNIVNLQDARQYTIQQVDGVVQTLSEKELNKRYIGYCWFIKPKIDADISSELPEYHLPKSWFFKVIWRFRKYYYQVILATVLINFLALVSSLYVMNVYDRVIPNKAYETLWVLSIGVFIAISFEFIAKIIRGRLTDIAGKKADLIISSALFRRVLGLRLQDRPASSGSYASNLRDFESVRDFMTSASLLTLVDLPFLLLFLFVLWLIAGKLVIVPATIIPLVMLIGIIAQFPLKRYINESMRESSQRQGLAVESIDGVETLKTNNAYNWAQTRWDAYTAKSAKSSMKVKNTSNLVIFLTMSLQQMNTVFLVLLGTHLIHSENPDSRITMGALIASVILSGRALAPLGQIAGLAVRFQQAMLALNGANAIAERPIERDVDRKYITFDQTKGELTFDKVSFAYTKESGDVFKELSLSIKPGEKVGILGTIGSGKSTALKLALGLYEPTNGSVTLDNVDLRQIDPAFLRSQILLLEQKPHLFLGTLRENLDLARMDNFASNQELLVALERFGLAKFIQNHPSGLDMPLGAGGLGLSGGQKQVIALARMTLRNPRIALLDEPTTGLDQATEIRSLRAIAQWAKNRTMVIVTHRPQVLQIVDRIIIIDDGKVVMDGPRDEVLKRLRDNENKNKAARRAARKQPQTVVKPVIKAKDNKPRQSTTVSTGEQ
ncbi:MAG: type I secretion system permease/ATPase [Gammaproteobacteria bacterium]|nr:MAG: type I secretion system permease/ATPase [Gammaproteobacteria bacterium]